MFLRISKHSEQHISFISLYIISHDKYCTSKSPLKVNRRWKTWNWLSDQCTFIQERNANRLLRSSSFLDTSKRNTQGNMIRTHLRFRTQFSFLKQMKIWNTEVKRFPTTRIYTYQSISWFYDKSRPPLINFSLISHLTKEHIKLIQDDFHQLYTRE